jgi:hypothetical protein
MDGNKLPKVFGILDALSVVIQKQTNIKSVAISFKNGI